MECLTGFASSIARDLVCGAVGELRYPCCFNDFVEDLRKEEDKFVKTRNNVQDRVEQAKKQTRKTAQDDEWLKEANTLTDNVEELLQTARTNKSCCFGHCPDWIWRYRVGKQLAEKKRRIIEICREGCNNAHIERLASLPGLRYFSSERCLKFDSRESAYEQLMEALKGDEFAMIGVYGMGGCGKTTLAVEVGKTAEAEHLFDKVIFVIVSSIVEVQRIQKKIASSLDLEIKEKEEMQMAQRLCMRLTQEKKILLILDDVWQRLDFAAIGIPSSKNHKVLITTRFEHVCASMDCQRRIPLLDLTYEDAWALFQREAGLSRGSSNTLELEHLGRQISNECGGLPVAIAAVAGTLKGKAKVEWEVALDRLRASTPVTIERGLQNPYNCLRLSYDNLDIEEAKSLFLLCSVFPASYEFPVELLTRFAIGLGIVGEVHSYKAARNEVSAAKNKLISSCMLSGNDEENFVKMHDLVRDVALRIAKNENKVIKCALKKGVKMEYGSMRYLWCEEFPNQMDCVNLEFLYLDTDLEVSYENFKAMEKLRVLTLVNDDDIGRRPLLTTSFKSLTNLSCLLLAGWELSDISFVGDIKKLESLTNLQCFIVLSVNYQMML